MDVNGSGGMLRHFRDLEDPRRPQGRRHELFDMMVIAICAVICGADGWTQVELFGRCKRTWFETFLRLPHGIPSHDTFGRVFGALSPEALEGCFMKWMHGLAAGSRGRLVAVDGKTLRRSFDRASNKTAVHMISAWSHASQMVLGQLATEAKSNEITAIPRLLKLLDLSGAVVSIDAMGCQSEIAQTIVDQGGDYLLQVKANQGTLLQDLELLFAEGLRDDGLGVGYAEAQQVNGGHGRVEQRRCWTRWDVATLGNAGAWPALHSVACVECVRMIGDQVQSQRRYYISSLPGRDADQMLRLIRGHWSIENGLHWRLDVQFGDDDRRIRVGHAAENYSRLSRIALNLLKADKTVKVGVKSKRLKAGWDHDYLLRLLTSPP